MLDYYIGVPLCFLGTLVKRLFPHAGSGSSRRTPRNILLIELSEMGSAILADPAMQKLKRELNANLFFAIFRKNKQSLDILKSVPDDNIFTIDGSSIGNVTAGTLKFIAWTRRNQIDTVIDLELFSRYSALLSGFSGARHIVGFHAFKSEGLYRGNFLTHKVAYNPHQHIAKNFLALTNALLSNRAELPYSKTRITDEEMVIRRITVDEEAKTAMHQKIREAYPDYEAMHHRIVIFNTNSSDLLPLRRWPQESYSALAGRILDLYPKVIILLTGDATERAGNTSIITIVNDKRCINFAGLTTVAELPALYSISELMLTNDSGPAHFASVTNMPTYVFFGPETPRLYSPLGNTNLIYSGLACSPCVSASNHRRSACSDNVCLRIITSDEVFSVLRPGLDMPRQ